MADQIIKINKSTVNNEIAEKSINRVFSELVPKQELVSIDQFFDYYNQLFYNIPRNGTLSHKTIIDQSLEYYGNYQDPKDLIIIQLEERIRNLESQLLDSELVDEEGNPLIPGTEQKTVKLRLRLNGGGKLGKKKSRRHKNYKITFTDFEGNDVVKKGSYNDFRNSTHEFTTQGPGTTYRIQVFGFVEKNLTKKEFVHQYDSSIKTMVSTADPEILEEVRIDYQMKDVK